MAMTIGIDMFHAAELISDTVEAIEYGPVKAMPGLQKLGITPNSSTATAFYDNGPGETAATSGAIELTIQKAFLQPEEEAFLLGKTIDTNGVIVSGADDVPPTVAVGFRTVKSNGKHGYRWYLKGVFSEPEEEIETKGEEINFQGLELKGAFSKTTHQLSVAANKKKQAWLMKADEENPTSAGVIAKWFTKPYIGLTAEA